MAILASDTFNRANVASGWGTATDGETWAAVRNTPTWSVSSNEGLYTAQSAGAFTIARIGSGSNGPQELLIRVKPGSAAGGNNIGLVARFSSSSTFYYAVLNGNLTIGKDVSGTFTTLGTGAFSYGTTNFYWLRFNLVGSALKLRGWQDGSSEPGTWNVSVTDSAITSGGYGVGSDSLSQSSYDSLTVTDASTGLASTLALMGVG